MTESPSDFYSRRPEKYDSKYGYPDDVSERLVNLADLFASKVEKGKILDAGCGTGRETHYFSRKGFDVIGIDVAEKAIELARKRKEGSYKVMDFRDLKFNNRSFSGVWCVAAIFFMEKKEMKNSLKEFERVLKPKGLLHVSFKEGEGKRVKEKRGGKINEYLVSESEAKKMIKDAGFEIIKESTTENSQEKKFMNFIARKAK